MNVAQHGSIIFNFSPYWRIEVLLNEKRWNCVDRCCASVRRRLSAISSQLGASTIYVLQAMQLENSVPSCLPITCITCCQALVERVHLASKREQSLQEREAAVAAREEELHERLLRMRWGLPQVLYRHLPMKGYLLITETKCRGER